MKIIAKIGGIMWNWITHRVNHPLWRAACLIGAFVIFGFIPVYFGNKYYSVSLPAAIGYTVILSGCALVVIWFLSAIIGLIADWVKWGSLTEETIRQQMKTKKIRKKINLIIDDGKGQTYLFEDINLMSFDSLGHDYGAGSAIQTVTLSYAGVKQLKKGGQA